MIDCNKIISHTNITYAPSEKYFDKFEKKKNGIKQSNQVFLIKSKIFFFSFEPFISYESVKKYRLTIIKKKKRMPASTLDSLHK